MKSGVAMAWLRPFWTFFFSFGKYCTPGCIELLYISYCTTVESLRFTFLRNCILFLMRWLDRKLKVPC
jgi:hypothetical protein